MATVEQTPGELNISVVQGDDLSIQLTEDSNFSGYTFIATIHQLHGSSVTCATSFVATAASSTVQVDFPAVTTGATGSTGLTGATGPTGATGASGTNVAYFGTTATGPSAVGFPDGAIYVQYTP
jgi:hypothetical protein